MWLVVLDAFFCFAPLAFDEHLTICGRALVLPFGCRKMAFNGYNVFASIVYYFILLRLTTRTTFP